MSKKCKEMVVLTVLLLGGTVAHADLVGYWPFNDGAGTIAVDASGYGHDAVVEGGGDSAWVEGQLGSAIEVGNGVWVSVPPEAWAPVDNQLTVAFWAFGYDGLGQNWGFFATAPGSNRMVSNHLPWTDGNVYYDTADSAGAWESERISQPLDPGLATGAWNHWAFTKNTDTGEKHIYLNGELWLSGTDARGLVTEISVFAIGSGPNGMQQYLGVIDDFQLYDVELTQQEIRAAMQGISKTQASAPTPEDARIDLPRDVTLSWEAGEYAVTHDVYLATVFEDVNDASRDNPMGVLVSEGQTATSYDIDGVLEYGQTYYWRIDEVNGAPDNTIFTGTTWSFTVEPLAYSVAGVIATSNGVSEAGVGPENTVNGSGLNENDEHSIAAGDMWLATPAAGEALYIQYEFDSVYKLHEMLVWNYNVQFEPMLGFGLKDVTVEYSEDGEAWTVLSDVVFNQAAANASYTANTTIDFEGVGAKFVRLTVNSGYGPLGQFGLSEVRFLYVPVQAREPEPADGTADVSVDAMLAWRSGREAVSHEVYLGTDAEALALAGVATESSYAPDDLALASTYYWKVDEVNEAEAVSTWQGNVWSFSTEEFVVVDDFESYNDDGNLIYESWADGWVNGTGSTVGYMQAPFAEQTIVHGGSQSMPLSYDNSAAATSEADLTLATSQDWTRGGITTLTLYFRGTGGNGGGQFYAKINGTKVAFDGDAGTLSKLRWQQWNIDLASVGTNLTNVTTVTVGVEGSGSGIVYVDDLRLYRQAPAVAEPVDPGTDGILLEYTFDSGVSDSSGNGYDGTLLGDARVEGGVLALDGIRDAMAVPRIGGDEALFSAFTVSLWMRPSVDVGPLDYSGGMNTDGWAAGAMHLKFRNGFANVGINGLPDLQGTSVGVANAWNHMAVTVSETEMALYMNGALEDSQPLEAPVEVILGGASLGAWNNADTLQRELTGEMDNVVIYDHALSAGEILFLADE